jgi:hypothetical protein
MIDHDFEIQDRQKADLTDFLKKRQTEDGQENPGRNQAFNKVIHVDLINANLHRNETSDQTILSITDDTRTFNQVAVLANDKIDSIAASIWHHWCQPYGPPETILSNQGKVWTSKLENRINDFMLLEQKIRCRSRKDTFNQEVQQQWQQNQHDTSVEEFAQNWNFLCNFQGSDKSKIDHGRLNDGHQNLDDVEDFMEDDTDFEEDNFEALGRGQNLKRKRVSLCRHKLQGRAYPRCRNKKMTQQQPQQFSKQEEGDLNYEWLQLIQMENFIQNQKRELLENGAQDLHDEDKAWNEHQETERDLIEGEEDTLDDEDLAYITTILNSFSKPKLINPVSTEGAPARAPIRSTTPPKFNQQFNQNSMFHGSEDENFSYFSNFEEKGHTDLADYFSNEEDDTWDNETFSSEGDTWSQQDFDNSENFQIQEHKPSEFDTALFGLETINKTDFEEQGKTNNFNGISCLSKETQLTIGLFTAGILITGAYPHPDLNDHHHNQTNSSANKTNLTPTGNATLAAKRLAFIQASNEALYAHLDEALARINKNLQQNKELANRISRSPRAIKTIQALEAAIAMFEQTKPEPEYQTSEYATHNRRWKRAPRVHPVEITELLNYEVQNKHSKNKILGDKVAPILKQNTDLSDKIAEEYQKPSEKLKKDPIMALVTRTVSTYMLLKHNRNVKTHPKTDNFSSCGEPFFKKKE